ncbi:hypothetical protein [Adhaeribacter aquaticus]|uniref:hypothetical protein n=1 Tax=Adhaeribacter aquaticus TaxID=299567 RepID=UPI000422BF48|nr:hypothetical protein [Adhaeribacter aquaticus]
MKIITLITLVTTNLILFTSSCTHQHVVGYTGAAAPANGTPAATTTPRADLEGNWDYKMTGDQDVQPLSGALHIRRNGASTSGYTGHITVIELDIDADTEIGRAELNGQNFTYDGRIQTGVGPIPFTLTGTIIGNSLNGQGEIRLPQGNTTYKITATRR